MVHQLSHNSVELHRNRWAHFYALHQLQHTAHHLILKKGHLGITRAWAGGAQCFQNSHKQLQKSTHQEGETRRIKVPCWQQMLCASTQNSHHDAASLIFTPLITSTKFQLHTWSLAREQHDLSCLYTDQAWYPDDATVKPPLTEIKP
jgi:hypothetical protein